MRIATLLPILLLLLVRTNCHPRLEDELVGNGNFLDDEFLDDAAFPSLLDPVDTVRFNPRLSPFLQPPTIDFQGVVESFPEVLPLDESEKFSKKPIPGVFVRLPPSMVIEPPTKEFYLNPGKGVTGHFSLESFQARSRPELSLEPPTREFDLNPGKGMTGHFSLESFLARPRPELSLEPPTREFGLNPGKGMTGHFSLESFQARPRPELSLEPPTREFGLNPGKVIGHFSLESFQAGPREDPNPDTLSSGNPGINQMKDQPTKKTDLETAEGRKEKDIEEPSRILLPPTKEFFVDIQRSLVPPTEEFSADGSN